MRAIGIVVMLLLASTAYAGGVYIDTINYSNGRILLTNRTWWNASARDIQRWKSGDQVHGVQSNSCGYGPNSYLLTDVDQELSTCAQWIGR